jgi:hypothetical protein
MKWTKIGKIFDPVRFKLPNRCHEYAQSPQALVFEDFVRIYFSTREKDEAGGKFRSHVAYVDFDKSFKKIIGVSTETVIPLGGLGTFDEHGIFPINVLRRGHEVLAYTCGWSRRVSVSVETATGFAVSTDSGKTFTKLGEGPVMTASTNEPFLVGDSFVTHEAGEYHMWYIYGLRWIANVNEEPARVYKIAYANSDNGVDWNRDGVCIIPDRLNKDECQRMQSKFAKQAPGPTRN